VRPASALLVTLVTLLMLAACSRGKREDEQTETVPVRVASSSEPNAPRAGDIRITSTGNETELALIGDTISAGLSQAAVAKVRHETESDTSASGLSASIERMVKSTVRSALGTRFAVPLSAVKDVRYESGKLVFEWNGKPPQVFVHTSVNGKPFLESFPPEEAQRFVDAVRARKRARGEF
jgi:hypothetical protein